jgi:hypothetical protein
MTRAPVTAKTSPLWPRREGLQEPPSWARVVSNHRPLACEASALPLSYAPGRETHHTAAGSDFSCGGGGFLGISRENLFCSAIATKEEEEEENQLAERGGRAEGAGSKAVQLVTKKKGKPTAVSFDLKTASSSPSAPCGRSGRRRSRRGPTTIPSTSGASRFDGRATEIAATTTTAKKEPVSTWMVGEGEDRRRGNPTSAR